MKKFSFITIVLLALLSIRATWVAVKLLRIILDMEMQTDSNFVPPRTYADRHVYIRNLYKRFPQ